MAPAMHVALCCFVGFAGMFVYNILDLSSPRKHDQWMAAHRRVYKDKTEKALRLEIFKKNVKYIEAFNKAGKYNYTLRVNKFADLTSEEFMATYYTGGGAESPEAKAADSSLDRSLEGEVTDSLNSSIFVKSSVDWRPLMTSVKDQGKCGCCYAFACIATVETVYSIEKKIKPPKSLSVQQILDCDNKNHGCQGGSRSETFEYIIKNKGLNTEENYPYKAAKGTCDKEKEKVIGAYIKGYKSIYPGENNLKTVVSKRPVVVGIAPPPQWQFFGKGVFEGPCGTKVNHFVVIAGYGKEKETRYWIVRNSWGSDWADGGYIKIKRKVDHPQGLCGIVSEPPMWPTM